MVRVYWNLHKKCWSVQEHQRRDHGRLGWVVTEHTQEFVLRDPQFRVSQSGRERVLREKRKNVHAFIMGTPISIMEMPDCEYELIRYNPYETSEFVYSVDGEAVVGTHPKIAFLRDGRVWVNARP